MAYLDSLGLESIASQLGVPFWLFIIIFVWIIVWKLLALWKYARNNHIAWFLIIAVINTIGILEILYIYVFSKLGKDKSGLFKRSQSKENKKSSRKKK
ncbi:MAG: DUF5652 family protein [Nanoarchaeota archaeon]|nr:DUF5652 family protein [Nanoarchaeota archaeon]